MGAAATLQMFILERSAGTESRMLLSSQSLPLALVSLQGSPKERAATCFLECAASGGSDDIETLSGW